MLNESQKMVPVPEPLREMLCCPPRFGSRHPCVSVSWSPEDTGVATVQLPSPAAVGNTTFIKRWAPNTCFRVRRYAPGQHRHRFSTTAAVPCWFGGYAEVKKSWVYLKILKNLCGKWSGFLVD